MQRVLNNLLTVAVIGLVSTSASLVLAHGGGGHSGGGHSSGGHSAGGHSMGHSSGSHSGGGHSLGHSGSSHSSTGHSTHSGHSSHSGHNSHTHSVGGTKGHKPTHPGHLTGGGTIGHNRPGHNPSGRHPGDSRSLRHRWPYHMHYPAGFWFSGDYDVADGDVAGGIDVEFTKISQLDAGDPSQNLAPAYRVWFHNNSDVDINQPFDVAILASADGQLAQDLPYASIRVDGIAADDTMSVDIRLPIEAMSMATSDGQSAEFAYVHSIIDSQKELLETNKANNLSVDSSDTIPAVTE